ncbi:MAG: macro domain-containing protein [Clostridia bacterium]|nr:macro domain-containing protein [Clostridia bacterium]
MPFEIIRNDITKMKADAIVNAANPSLKMGGGVCGAIFTVAGAVNLQKECDSIGHCDVGQAVMTKGYLLPSKYIIHTAGPVWKGGDHQEDELLSSCYRNSLKLALNHKLHSIAFPLISSGIYGYPKESALQIAVSTISEFLKTSDMMVYLVVYDKTSFVLSEKLVSSVSRFIDEHYVDEMKLLRPSGRFNQIEDLRYEEIEALDQDRNFKLSMEVSAKPARSKKELGNVISDLDESFSEMLLRVIDEKDLNDVTTYKKANIDRKLFSKIRSNRDYKPSKVTAVAFAIALELNIDETGDLLLKAGYALSRSLLFDVIIEYFINEGLYDIFEINATLFHFEQPLIGA